VPRRRGTYSANTSPWHCRGEVLAEYVTSCSSRARCGNELQILRNSSRPRCGDERLVRICSKEDLAGKAQNKEVID